MQATQRREPLPALSKLNGTGARSTRVLSRPPLWTFCRRAPLSNRPLLHDDRIVHSRQFPNDYTWRCLPTFFDGMLKYPWLLAALKIVRNLMAAYLFIRFLRFVEKKAKEDAWSGELNPVSGTRRKRKVLGPAIQAVKSPLAFAVTGTAFLHSLKVFLEFMSDLFLKLIAAKTVMWYEAVGDIICDLLLLVLSPVVKLTEMVIQPGLLLALVWLLIGCKNEFVAWVVEEKFKDEPKLVPYIRRLVIPLSTLTSWIIAAWGIVAGIAFAGYDVLPLLAVAGVGGTLSTFATQSVWENLFAGILLFVSRPFVAGDCIQTRDAEKTLLFSGTVEQVNPLRTVIRTDENLLMTVPNKLLSDMIIGKELQSPTTSLADLDSGRRIGASLTLTRDHFGKLDEIRAMIESLLESFDGMNHEMPHGVNIGSLANDKVTLEIFASAQMRENHKPTELQAQLMQALREGLKQHGIEDFEFSNRTKQNALIK